MSLKKVKKKIDKIQRTIELLDGNVSAIERDLLLVYIRDLYEEVLDLNDESPSHISSPSVQVPTTKQEVTPEPRPIPEKKVDPVEVKEEVHQTEAPKEEVVSEDQNKEVVNEDLLKLFEVKEAEELGDKLSKLPIKNLSKAMSINERIFTINELFGGDHELFTHTIDHLNGLGNYDEAVDYLTKGVAAEHDWQDPQHLKKAEQFIHLVQRRFR